VRIAVTGSIANDHLMTFPGRFVEQIVPEHLDRLSLSFLVDGLTLRRGGVAANIAFGLGQLGIRAVVVAAVGRDFDDYRAWLVRHGVDTSGIHVSEVRHTARFMVTTDLDDNQIAFFYPGAMVEARDIALRPIADRLGGLDLVVVSPDDPDAMRRHTDEAREMGVPFVADPSQQLARIDGATARELVDGAEYLVANDYERALLESKTGWSSDEVLGRVGTRVTTLGPKGCSIERRGDPAISVAATAPEGSESDPTGVGDAFRAGFLAGRVWGLELERCAQIGSLVATHAFETIGTQEYVIDAERFLRRFAAAYGDDAANEVAPAFSR